MRVEADRDFGRRECPSCTVEVPANTNDCPICGYAFPTLNPRQRGMRIGGGLVMLLLFIYLAFRLGRWVW